jgi:hypothetical protein
MKRKKRLMDLYMCLCILSWIGLSLSFGCLFVGVWEAASLTTHSHPIWLNIATGYGLIFYDAIQQARAFDDYSTVHCLFVPLLSLPLFAIITNYLADRFLEIKATMPEKDRDRNMQ